MNTDVKIIDNAQLINAIKTKNHGTFNEEEINHLIGLVPYVFPEPPKDGDKPRIQANVYSTIKPPARVIELLSGFGRICGGSGMVDQDGMLSPYALRDTALSFLMCSGRTSHMSRALAIYPCDSTEHARQAIEQYESNLINVVSHAFYSRNHRNEIHGLRHSTNRMVGAVTSALGAVEKLEPHRTLRETTVKLVTAYLNLANIFVKKDTLLGLNPQGGGFFADGNGGVYQAKFDFKSLTPEDMKVVYGTDKE